MCLAEEQAASRAEKERKEGEESTGAGVGWADRMAEGIERRYAADLGRGVVPGGFVGKRDVGADPGNALDTGSFSGAGA